MKEDPLKSQKASFSPHWKSYLFCRLHAKAGFRKVFSLTGAQGDQIPNFKEKPSLLILTTQIFSTTSSSLCLFSSTQILNLKTPKHRDYLGILVTISSKFILEEDGI